MQNKSKLNSIVLEIYFSSNIFVQRIILTIYFINYQNSRAGNSRNPSGGSSNGSNNPGVLPPQFVQVEMTNPDDQQFIVYTE